MKKKVEPIVEITAEVDEKPKRKAYNEIQEYRPKFADLWRVNKQYPPL